MATHFEKDDNLRVRIEVFLKPAINRYLKRKYLKWTKENVEGVLDIEDANHPAVVDRLKEWESDGYIRINDSGGCFFEVLKPLPETQEEDASN